MVLVGEGRHFPAVLIVPDFAVLSSALGIAKPADTAAAAALAARPEARAPYAALIEQINRKLAQFERIKQFHLLPRDFTLDAGELTPTFKVKRRAIDVKYKAEIETMYRE